jgi:hypothetical protein
MCCVLRNAGSSPEAVWVVCCIWGYVLAAEVAGDALVVHNGPVLRHGAVEERSAAGLHVCQALLMLLGVLVAP